LHRPSTQVEIELFNREGGPQKNMSFSFNLELPRETAQATTCWTILSFTLLLSTLPIKKFDFFSRARGPTTQKPLVGAKAFPAGWYHFYRNAVSVFFLQQRDCLKNAGFDFWETVAPSKARRQPRRSRVEKCARWIRTTCCISKLCWNTNDELICYRLHFLSARHSEWQRAISDAGSRRDGIQRTEQLVQRANARKMIQRALKSKGCLYILQNCSTNLDLTRFDLDCY